MAKVKGRHSFFNIPAQLLPIVSLRDYTLRQPFRDEPAIRIWLTSKISSLIGPAYSILERYKAAMHHTVLCEPALKGQAAADPFSWGSAFSLTSRCAGSVMPVSRRYFAPGQLQFSTSSV